MTAQPGYADDVGASGLRPGLTLYPRELRPGTHDGRSLRSQGLTRTLALSAPAHRLGP